MVWIDVASARFFQQSINIRVMTRARANRPDPVTHRCHFMMPFSLYVAGGRPGASSTADPPVSMRGGAGRESRGRFSERT
jgi:hypothetical protein